MTTDLQNWNGVTVTGSHEEGEALVLETLDPDPRTDLITQEGHEMVRADYFLSDEEKERLDRFDGELPNWPPE